MTQEIKYIDEAPIKNKKVLLRVDFNVALTKSANIADDFRIKQSLPTINFLLKNKNKIILVSHLGRPKGRDLKLSLKPVVNHLQKILRNYKIILVNDFLSDEGRQQIKNQNVNEILVLENIRFYSEEKNNDLRFSKQLSEIADIYVNDAFGVSHRKNSSICNITKFIPSYGGLLLKKEVETISQILQNPKKPFIAIIGGAKISDKIFFVDKLLDIADHVLIGGGVADILFKALGYEIGKSIDEKGVKNYAEKLKNVIMKKNSKIILPVDVIVGDSISTKVETEVKKATEVSKNKYILDIGPEAQAVFGSYIASAKTIIWNGPLGYFENPIFSRGTDFIYYAITQNTKALSIVGGGSTLAAIKKKEYLNKISHISTGGGAMLEFIEKGTLPGIEALKN
jgi:phosphoglycerate kinase